MTVKYFKGGMNNSDNINRNVNVNGMLFALNTETNCLLKFDSFAGWVPSPFDYKLIAGFLTEVDKGKAGNIVNGQWPSEFTFSAFLKRKSEPEVQK